MVGNGRYILAGGGWCGWWHSLVRSEIPSFNVLRFVKTRNSTF